MVESDTAVEAPPITPASATGPLSSQISSSEWLSSTCWSLSKVSDSPALARRTRTVPDSSGAEKACMAARFSSIMRRA